MQALRPHEQAKVDKAKQAYANASKLPYIAPKSHSVNYTGKKYQHKLTKVVYLGVRVTESILNPNPVMAWVHPENEDKITTIPFSLLDEI
jgi:hypothetical protein